MILRLIQYHTFIHNVMKKVCHRKKRNLQNQKVMRIDGFWPKYWSLKTHLLVTSCVFKICFHPFSKTFPSRPHQQAATFAPFLRQFVANMMWKLSEAPISAQVLLDIALFTHSFLVGFFFSFSKLLPSHVWNCSKIAEPYKCISRIL